MYYIGLDVYKKTISYFAKDVTGHIQQQGMMAARNNPRTYVNLVAPCVVLHGVGSLSLQRSIEIGHRRNEAVTAAGDGLNVSGL